MYKVKVRCTALLCILICNLVSSKVASGVSGQHQSSHRLANQKESHRSSASTHMALTQIIVMNFVFLCECVCVFVFAFVFDYIYLANQNESHRYPVHPPIWLWPKKLLADHTVMDFVFVLVLLFAIVFVSSNTKRLSSISSAPTHIALTQIYSWQITLLIHLYLYVVCILIVSLSGKSKRVSSVSSTPVWLWPNILQADHPVLSLYLSHTKTMKTKSVEFGNQQSPIYPFNFGRIHVGTE